VAAKRTSGKGCIARARGIHRVAIRFIRSQLIRVFWLRRLSVRRQYRIAWSRQPPGDQPQDPLIRDPVPEKLL